MWSRASHLSRKKKKGTSRCGQQADNKKNEEKMAREDELKLGVAEQVRVSRSVCELSVRKKERKQNFRSGQIVCLNEDKREKRIKW